MASFAAARGGFPARNGERLARADIQLINVKSPQVASGSMAG
jgi:hypothetical protein